MRDELIAWLNDAHAMEQTLIPILDNHARDADRDRPAAAARLREHVWETRRHVQRLEECLGLLGTSPSMITSALSSLMGSIESVGTAALGDEVVKNVLMDYAAEQFEVACYKALVAAANEIGEARIARLCQENLLEDEAMANWLDRQIPLMVTSFQRRRVAPFDSH